MHCNTAPFDNNDLRLALKYAMDRETMVKKILGGYGTVGNDFPINNTYALFPEGIEQRAYDPDKAAFHYKKSGHSGSVLLRTSDVAFPGAVDAAVLYPGKLPRRPASRSRSSASRATATGPTSGTSSPSRPPTGAAVRPRTRCIPPPISRRPTGTTRASSVRTSTSCCSRPAPNSTRPSARSIYRTMAMMVRDEGGLILPMFNDFVERLHQAGEGLCPRYRQRHVERLRRDPRLA